MTLVSFTQATSGYEGDLVITETQLVPSMTCLLTKRCCPRQKQTLRDNIHCSNLIATDLTY